MLVEDEDDLYARYHDEEWGRPVADGRIGLIYVVLNPDKLRTRCSTNPQPPNVDSASIQIR